MELENKNDNYDFNPTPRLKSSSIQIPFIPFNNEKHRCFKCENKYSESILYQQKYCKKCFLSYIKSTIGDNNAYLNVYIFTNLTQCVKHNEENKNKRSVQEWCESCFEVSHFKNYYDHHNSTKAYKITTEKDCELCGKMIYDFWGYFKFRICSDCYLIYSGWIESSFTEKPIPILYLPWWDASNKSSVCSHNLKLLSDCQKWCPSCFIIYVGCRYCLTTNIIFGITNKTQCKKCQRESSINIDVADISSGDHNIDEFLFSTRTNIDAHHRIADYMNIYDYYSDPLNVYSFIERMLKDVSSKRIMEWIPYLQIDFENNKIAEGGFGTVYKATWLKKTPVAVKKFTKSHDIKHFLNELKSLHRCYDTTFIIKYYGITQDPEKRDYMLIMPYASGGDLHKYLKKNFANIKWITRLTILSQISDGLKAIHNENFIHRDFHTGNILSLKENHNKWVIGDLGLSQPANNLSNNEIYGVIPYIAPEIFRGANFSKKSDIFSMGMIMWELTTGCKPFAKVEHNVDLVYDILDGKRPTITEDTPECFANLMQRCWDSDPAKRPNITEIKKTVDDWYKRSSTMFCEAEKKRLNLIQSKSSGPKKFNPGAMYTSRRLCVSSIISGYAVRNSSINNDTSTPRASSSNLEYITRYLGIDADKNILKTSSKVSEYITRYLGIDIETNIPKTTKVSEYVSRYLGIDIDISTLET